MTLSPEILASIQHALEEDLGPGDVTSRAIFPLEAQARGQIIAKQNGVAAGLEVAAAVFARLDPQLEFSPLVADGAAVEKRQPLALVSGAALSIFSGERVALNFLGRMSGIATLTRQFVDSVAGTRAQILDTRKTAPGLRAVDKLAVALGGGKNHRLGLYDMILLKDNHIDFAGSVTEALRRARAAASGLEIEVEVRTLAQLREALEGGARRILLDNMTLEELRAAVELTAGRAKLEASGNVNLQRVCAIAETGVDFISIGALTHSAPVLDVSLDILM
ncbi:MAG: carboxylating nicotinate-nucleotide diphosphorylase [Anaerolineales bacterium]